MGNSGDIKAGVIDIPLKLKYRAPKPKGRFRADYNGNSGKARHKHVLRPRIHGIRRKTVR